jgi:hypothetical protein
MERVVKGIMGHYGAEKPDKPATHVILTVEEYNDLKSDIRQAKNETQATINKSNSQVADYKLKAETIIKNERSEAQKRIEAIQSDLNKATNEIHRLNDLNANLLRINKERANAKRGLKPKKEHHGYMVIDSQQYNYVFRYWVRAKANSEDFPCWKVRIQSPYNSSIPFDTIHENIYDDSIKIFGSKLGLNSICDVSTYKFQDFKEMWDSDKNFIFKTSYKANIKSGLWEVEYLVKSSITVPEDMRTA